MSGTNTPRRKTKAELEAEVIRARADLAKALEELAEVRRRCGMSDHRPEFPMVYRRGMPWIPDLDPDKGDLTPAFVRLCLATQSPASVREKFAARAGHLPEDLQAELAAFLERGAADGGEGK